MALTASSTDVNHLLLLILVFGIIVPVTVGSAVLWVVVDAATRRVSWPRKYVSVVVLTYPLFPLWIIVFRLRHERTQDPGPKYYIVRNIAIGSVIVPPVAVLMSPPSITVQIFNWTFALLLVVAGSYLYEWL